MLRLSPAAICLALGLALLLTAGCGPGAPADRIKGHIDAVSDLLTKHAGSPAEGVTALRAYARKNLPDVMHALGQMATNIDKADGEERKRLVEEFNNTCAHAFKVAMPAQGFMQALQKDPAAHEAMQEWSQHLQQMSGALQAVTPYGGMVEDSKWSEGKANAGMIRQAISTWVARNSGTMPDLPSGHLMENEDAWSRALRLTPMDFSGMRYFRPEDFTIEVINSDRPVEYIIRVRSSVPEGPDGEYTLDQDGVETGP